jgi:hypothetical protein
VLPGHLLTGPSEEEELKEYNLVICAPDCECLTAIQKNHKNYRIVVIKPAWVIQFFSSHFDLIVIPTELAHNKKDEGRNPTAER